MIALRLYGLALLVGTSAGLLSVGFEASIEALIHFKTILFDSQDQLTLGSFIIAFFMSALLAIGSLVFIQKLAPEAAGSGIPEVERAMLGKAPLRWHRILPAKFFGGVGALGSGMVLGQEGPVVQMGGAIGAMVSRFCHLDTQKANNTLLASGAAAGLAAAFNAPLAAILFVVEEMRPQFRYSSFSIKAVFIATIASVMICRTFKGQHPLLPLPDYHTPTLDSLTSFLILGLIMGIIGVGFNRALFHTFAIQKKIHRDNPWRQRVWVGLIGGTLGSLALTTPQATSSGMALIPDIIAHHPSITALLLLLIVRFGGTLLCFTSGVPGGVFAPMLALGTLIGLIYGHSVTVIFPHIIQDSALFAVAGMSALFAASVRAPLTGILLVVEMTGTYHLILPLMFTCLTAVITAQWLGGKPLYEALRAYKYSD